MATEDIKIFNKNGVRGIRASLRNNQTFYEQILWSKLRGRQLKGLKFRRQYSIGKYIVDFYCPERKVAIEIDGDSHYNQGAENYDSERDDYINSLGLKIFRFTNKEVAENIGGVLEEIIRSL